MTRPIGPVDWFESQQIAVVSRHAFVQISILALLLTPLFSLLATGSANAQSVRKHAGTYSQGQPRKRIVVRRRSKASRKPKKSLFQGLFGNHNQAIRPRRGLKPLFGGLQGAVRAKPSPSALRASFAKRMRAAARKDALSANARLRAGFGSGQRRRIVNQPRNGGFSRRGKQNFAGNWGRGKYRTMCVRMCDGYYFPVRFKARARNFKSDEQRCNSNCYNAPTKLFYYSNPGGSIENMRALDGMRYKDLANAFRYRKEYVADCRCKAEPWTAQAKQQHESWTTSAQTDYVEVEEGDVVEDLEDPVEDLAQTVKNEPAESLIVERKQARIPASFLRY